MISVSPAFIGGCGLKRRLLRGDGKSADVSPAFIGGCGLKLSTVAALLNSWFRPPLLAGAD